MNRYIIYCSEEQTKKAFELGAPIIQTHAKPSNLFVDKHPMLIWVSTDDNYVDVGYVLAIPTAEQLIGWLEERGILVDVSAAFLHTNTPSYLYRIGFRFNDYVSNAIDYPSRKEATLAAIDNALDYLSKNKNK